MPIFEFSCRNADCDSFEEVAERFFKKTPDQFPDCPSCSLPREREMSKSIPLWARPLSFYDSPTAQQRGQDYHFGRLINSTPKGQVPKTMVIDSVQKQKEFCRLENLSVGEMNSNAEISADGKSWSTSGVKSQWV